MSNCCANSASVLSPLTAAKATFALKAGVWFRRGRLVIVSPVRHAYWPLSGKNSTYPDVQISRASSLANATLGVMTGASVAVAMIGKSLAQALLPKHAIKQVDRLLSNSKLEAWDVFASWVPEM